MSADLCSHVAFICALWVTTIARGASPTSAYKQLIYHTAALADQQWPKTPLVDGQLNTNGMATQFEVINEWKYMDFEYPSYVQRQNAIANGEFIPENNLPLGIDVHANRLFITTPRWKDGVPATLSYLPYKPLERSPALRPYPNWEAHGSVYPPECNKLISVYRTAVDKCGRLWAIDSGVVNATIRLNQICAPKIIAYDLNNDEMLLRYVLPEDQVRQGSLHTNLLVEVRNNRCDDAYVYITDVWQYGLVVYSLAKHRSWRVTNYQFSPTPTAANFNIYGLNFQWLDGVFGVGLSTDSDVQKQHDDAILYFHPMASFKEFMVSTNLLRNESLWPAKAQDVAKLFVEIGDRGINGQSSTSGISRNGVMFFTQVQRDAIGCWDTGKPYVRANLHLFGNNNRQPAPFTLRNSSSTTTTTTAATTPLISFPNDLKVDKQQAQGVWVMSNRLPIYLYSKLNYDEINFRVLRASADHIIHATVCDPERNGSRSVGLANVQLREGQCY